MARQIANMTVIRGNGACMAYMNGVVRDEVRRQQTKMVAERERARTVEASRDRLLARNLADIEEAMQPTRLQRLWRPVAQSWGVFWGVIFNMREFLIELGCKLDLIALVED